MTFYLLAIKASRLLAVIIGCCIVIYLSINGFKIGVTIPLLVNVSLFIIFLYVNIYLHEFGHLFIGKLVGLPVARVTIGTGKELISFPLWGTQIVITNNAGGGSTLPHNFGEANIKLKFMIFTLGGMLFQLLAVVIISFFFNWDPGSIITSNKIDSTGVFVWSNLLMVLFTLIPGNTQHDGMPVPNDGMRLLEIPFMKHNQINELLVSSIASSGVIYLKSRDYQKAAAIFQDSIAKYPDQPMSYINLAVAFIRLARFNDAIELLTNFKTKQYDEKYKPLLFNNLAWAHLMTFDADSLKCADELSEFSYRTFPDSRAFKGTRACTLIALGKAHDGLNLLKTISDAKKRTDDTTNPPSSLLFQAYAYWQLGEINEAQEIVSKINDTMLSKEKDLDHLFAILRSKTNNFQSEKANGKIF